MRSLFLNIALIILLSGLVVSCRKRLPDHYDIMVSGSPFKAKELRFSSNATVADGFLWNFGDGSSSTDPHPLHDYVNAGVYTITLTVNGVVSTEQLRIGNNEAEMTQFLGMHTWHHQRSLYMSATYADTTYYNDTSIAISVTDPVTMRVGAEELIYESSTDTSVTFRHNIDNNVNPMKYNILTLYPAQGTAKYTGVERASLNAVAYDRFTTP